MLTYLLLARKGCQLIGARMSTCLTYVSSVTSPRTVTCEADTVSTLTRAVILAGSGAAYSR